MKNQARLALQVAQSRKNYHVNLYIGEAIYSNKQMSISFYGDDYSSEADAKQAAIKKFLNTNGRADFYNNVTLTETNGMQIADKNEPYSLKSAIVRVLARKSYSR